MAYGASILNNKTGQQTILNLVPTLSGGQVVTAKQAYVFGGPMWLRGSNNSAIVATTDAGVMTYLNGLQQSGRIELEVLRKDPWPVATNQRVVIPSELRPSPFNTTSFEQNIGMNARGATVTYDFVSVKDLNPSSSTPTLNFAGRDAFVWYGHIELSGSTPVVVVANTQLDLTTIGAGSTTTDIDPVSTSGSPAALPEPLFDMLLPPFEQVKSFPLAAAPA
jgi:hypothetical protein